jgi:hypothetical protein
LLCALRFALLQSRAALMHKLAANAGLDVSNVPQIPLPQVVQPQVRRSGGQLNWLAHSCRACCQGLWTVPGLNLLVLSGAGMIHQRPWSL